MSRPIALFDAWRGAYDCNPRAISERLGVLHPEVRRVWVLRDPADAPDGVITVKPFSARHLYHLMRARYVFANNAMPSFWRKLPRTTYVQTWHGPGAFKKVGWDIPEPDPVWAAYLEKFAADVARWDLLVTSSPAATRHFPGAFRYSGPVLESGSPRSDTLIAAMHSGRRDLVRDRLGLTSARVTLWAPTFKDGGRSATEVADLLDRWGAELADDEVLLVRAHPNDTVLTGHVPGTSRIRNVSSEDGVDVLLAADVLVTDYSSIFYDFALTGRPVVFFVEDLEDYRDQARGFYLDMDRDLPGPVVRTFEELLVALHAVPETEGHRDWLAEHLPHDDGHAADRVIEAVLGTG